MTSPPDMTHDWFPMPLPKNVILGERSWCYSAFSCLHYRSERGMRIGHDTGIYHGTFFDLGPDAEVQIGNFCTLVGAILATNAKIIIEDYTFIAHEVVLADSFAATPPDRWDDFHETAPSAHRGAARSKPDCAIHIGPNCWIGARSVLLAGARLGEGAVIGAGTVVREPVAPYAVVAGNPARVVGSVPRRSNTSRQNGRVDPSLA